MTISRLSLINFTVCLFSITQAQQLITYDTIPGRAMSDHYTCRVKFSKEDNNSWRKVAVLQTRAKEKVEDTISGYFDKLRGWTASWIAFESDFVGDNIIVEISKKDGAAITKAMVRPTEDASEAMIVNGKAYVTFSHTANVNVDINGQMEDNYTGFGYNGPDVRTISLFANPIFHIPDTNNANVVVLQPGDDINALDRALWDTIVFAPGVHNIGVNMATGVPTPFTILDNEVLFIPGDAIVHGVIHPVSAWGDAASENWAVYGSGAISGEKIVRTPSDKSKIYKSFTNQAEGVRLEGFVVIDPAFHTFNMNSSRSPTTKLNIYKNLKILAWRVNSDGVNVFRNSEVSDCFLEHRMMLFTLVHPM